MVPDFWSGALRSVSIQQQPAASSQDATLAACLGHGLSDSRAVQRQSAHIQTRCPGEQDDPSGEKISGAGAWD